ncbi:MAG TPA: restriction endonuclease subunit S [Acidobacteriaceae bacterium]
MIEIQDIVSTGARTIPLSQAMAAIIDYRGKTPAKTTHGVPLITAKIIKGGKIEPPSEFISEDEYDVWMRRGMPQVGDVVITTEAPIGEVAQLHSERVALAQRVILLRGDAQVLDNTFLKYLMLSDEVQVQLRSRASGTTVTGIKQSELRKIMLRIPSLETQREIAATLDSLDRRIDLLKATNETLDAMARAIFKSWFVDFDPVRAKAEGREPDGMDAATAAFFPSEFQDSELGPLPERWVVRTIGDICEAVGGSTPSTKNEEYWNNGEFHWTTPKDLSDLKSPILLDSERKLTAKGIASVGSGLLPVGTVLLSSRAPIGYIAIAEISTAINQGFIAMKANHGVSNLFLWLWTANSIELIKSRANGSTFQEISKKNFRPILLAVPVAEVMERFDMITRPLYEKIVCNDRQRLLLTALRDTLLPRLISGKLRVPEAETMLAEAV